MGGLISKKPAETSSSINLNNNTQYTTEHSSYDCWLNNFHTMQQARTYHLINTIARGVEVTVCPSEMKQEVVKIILERQKDIWKNREFLELVEEYFKNSLQTLQFCPALEKCLKHAHNSQSSILSALQEFEEESNGDSMYVRTLEKIMNFKVAEFFQIFRAVYKQQILMSKVLQPRKTKLEEKINDNRFWRKVSSVIFVAIFAAVLICSIGAAAMAAPPVAAALAAAATYIPLGSMWKWIDSLFKNYANALKGQEEVISLMQVGTCDAIVYLCSIQVLIHKLKIDVEVVQNVDFAIEEEAVKNAVEEIKKQPIEFMKNVKDLGVEADTIRRRGIEVLKRIIKPGRN